MAILSTSAKRKQRLNLVHMNLLQNITVILHHHDWTKNDQSESSKCADSHPAQAAIPTMHHGFILPAGTSVVFFCFFFPKWLHYIRLGWGPALAGNNARVPFTKRASKWQMHAWNNTRRGGKKARRTLLDQVKWMKCTLGESWQNVLVSRQCKQPDCWNWGNEGIRGKSPR